MKKITLLLLTVLLAINGCSKPEEGPVEKIGKGLDQVISGMGELDAKGSPSPMATPLSKKGKRTFSDQELDEYYK